MFIQRRQLILDTHTHCRPATYACMQPTTLSEKGTSTEQPHYTSNLVSFVSLKPSEYVVDSFQPSVPWHKPLSSHSVQRTSTGSRKISSNVLIQQCKHVAGRNLWDLHYILKKTIGDYMTQSMTHKFFFQFFTKIMNLATHSEK